MSLAENVWCRLLARASAVWVCLAFSVACSYGAVWTGVTVITTDGWEYHQVSVAFAAGATSVTILNPNGGQRDLKVSMVRVIRDSAGRDVTASVLAAQEQPAATPDLATPAGPGAEKEAGSAPIPNAVPAAVPETLPPRPTEAAVAPPPMVPAPSPWQRPPSRPGHVFGKRFVFSPSLGLGFGSTTGDCYKGMSSGRSLDLSLKLAVADRWYLGFLYRDQKVGSDPDINTMEVDGYLIPVDWNIHLKETVGIVGVMSSPDKIRDPFFYAETGLGAIAHDMTATARVGSETVTSHTDESKFTLVFAAGAILPFSENWGADLSGNMSMVSVGGGMDEYGDETEGCGGFVLGLRLGLVCLLGK